MRALAFNLVLAAVSLPLLGLAAPSAKQGPVTKRGHSSGSILPDWQQLSITSPTQPDRHSDRASALPVATKDIWLYDNFYAPVTTLVPPGTTVRWTNKGFHHHTVTSQNGLWDSGQLEHGQVFSLTFLERGTYAYYCRIHAREMRGTVIVN